MHSALRAFHTVNLVAFVALGAVALVTWRRRRDRASVWAAAAFGSLALLELLSLIGPLLAIYRTLMLRKPVDREYLLGIIDNVVLPAAGVR